MKKIVFVIAAILLAALLGGGGFWAGMQYQSNQVDRVRASFLAQRGQGDTQFPGQGLQMPLDGQPPATQQGGGMGLFGGGLTGQIKDLADNVLTLGAAENVTTVNLSESTTVQMSVAASLSDLQPGMRVMVIGQPDSNGNLDASQVLILDSSPAATGTAP